MFVISPHHMPVPVQSSLGDLFGDVALSSKVVNLKIKHHKITIHYINSYTCILSAFLKLCLDVHAIICSGRAFHVAGAHMKTSSMMKLTLLHCTLYAYTRVHIYILHVYVPCMSAVPTPQQLMPSPIAWSLVARFSPHTCKCRQTGELFAVNNTAIHLLVSLFRHPN